MKMLVYALVAGVVIALLTGLIVHAPAMYCVSAGVCVVGDVYYGYPFSWLQMFVRSLPEPFVKYLANPFVPWVVDPLRLILDVVFWAAVVWVILFVVSKARKK
jgi:hypothetical protein